jgi:hypothetical protein
MAAPKAKPKEVQAPKERKLTDFTSMELLHVVLNPVVILKDRRGKKLGTLALDQKVFYEAEDVAAWAARLEDQLENDEVLERLRSEMAETANANGQPG